MKQISILHITNDYSGSTVYKNLCASLDDLNITQIVYNPIRKIGEVNKNKIDFNDKKSQIIYSKILNNYTRLNFHFKRKKIYKDLISFVGNTEKIDIVHAHTWYSDGAIAYKLFKDFQIPYIVTIRNTDLNLFFKYMIHLRSLGVKILQNAKKIIFISEIYKVRFCDEPYLKKYLQNLENKFQVIPNGIDKFWIENVFKRKKYLTHPIQLLYIGNFTRNKNVLKLIEAVEVLINHKLDLILHIVGGGGGNVEIEERVKRSNFAVNHGGVYERNKLMDLMRKSDVFTMPSKTETFGLVYIESLSQGLPIIYTKGEGIDGLYEENIGEAVNADDVKSISDGILKIINNYSDYNYSPKEIVNNHNWNKIAQKYNAIYRSSL